MTQSAPSPAPPPPPPSSHHYSLSTLGSALSWGYHRLSTTAAAIAAPPPNTTTHATHPPRRRASPYQPPPLSPLHLAGYSSSTTTRLLSRALAEEIRALLPARLQLAGTWTLAYSLEQHGTSLATLFQKSAEGGSRSHGKDGGAGVLVVRDAAGGVSLPIRRPEEGGMKRGGKR